MTSIIHAIIIIYMPVITRQPALLTDRNKPHFQNYNVYAVISFARHFVISYLSKINNLPFMILEPFYFLVFNVLIMKSSITKVEKNILL